MAMSRSQLIDLVRQIMEYEGAEAELDVLVAKLCENVPHPEVLNLIYYGPEDATPESIVDQALNPPTTYL